MTKSAGLYKRSHKTIFAIITIISSLVALILGIRRFSEYREALDCYGLEQALTGVIIVLIPACIAVVFALLFFISSRRSRYRERQKMIRLAERAEKAKARGEDFVLPEKSTGARVGSAISGFIDLITGIIIVILIVSLISIGGYTKLRNDAYLARPVFDVLDHVDISQCVTGYDGMAYIDQDKVIYTLPEDITEIYKTGTTFSETKNYSSEQAIWSQFLRDLKFLIEPDTSGGGTLSNGDTISVTPVLPGYTLPKLQAELSVMIEGIGQIKECTIEGLPYKYSDVTALLNEKSDVIDACFARLKLKAYQNYNSFKSSSLSGFIFDHAYLCKPEEGEDVNPDALLLMAHTNVDADTEYSSMHTMVIYVFPFSSDTSVDDIESKSKDASGNYDDSSLSVRTEFYNYSTPEQVSSAFESGINFSPGTAYGLTEIPWTVPVEE